MSSSRNQEARKPARSFEDLLVWQLAHALVLAIYRESIKFPKAELYGLVSQVRRAAVSIPANIAEGFKRRTKADKVRLMNVAQASAEEVRYYLILAHDLKYLDKTDLLAKLDEVSRMLDAYIKGIQRSMK